MKIEDIDRFAERVGFPTRRSFSDLSDLYPRLERFAELVRADERNSWPAEMEAMERQVNILTDALAEARADEREQLAQLADKVVEGKLWFNDLPAAIRARSNHD